jgi:MmyB-like transcription regulator ligand binding domain/Helix-turn-helix domain
VTTTSSAGGAARRAELRAFLTARRARVSPAEAGLPAGPRRRTPGLRREEVAVLAGVGVSWYQWLEQGRDITVSPQVLDAVVRVLRLNDSERRHLYVLAGLNPPLPSGSQGQPIGADLLRLIEAWMPKPAHITDRYWNLIAANDAARLVLGFEADDHENCLSSFFIKERYRSRYEAWIELAPKVVANYRAAMSAHIGDSGYAAVVDDLLERSPEFAEIWQRHDVCSRGILMKTMVHPTAGQLVFESSQLRLAERPDLSITLHNPCPGTDTARKVERLVEEERRRGNLRLLDAG